MNEEPRTALRRAQASVWRLLMHVTKIDTAVSNIGTNLSDVFGGTSRSLADRSRWSGWVPRYVMYPFFLYWSGAMPPTNF